jgi:hypothetical protein
MNAIFGALALLLAMAFHNHVLYYVAIVAGIWGATHGATLLVSKEVKTAGGGKAWMGAATGMCLSTFVISGAALGLSGGG